MSSYIARYKNPKTGKMQNAFCIDNYFGAHQYGYGFPKNGEDANFDDKGLKPLNCDWYKFEELTK